LLYGATVISWKSPTANGTSTMPVEILNEGTKLQLVHPKGSSAEVLLYGATVISWKSPTANGTEPVEHLFVSSKAALDGSKPVRGGIPVVFPCFGAPSKPQHASLPQHGYARNHIWSWDGLTHLDNDVGVSVKLTYSPDRSLTADEVKLVYVITLAEHQLSTNLHVENTSKSTPLEFQALLHTYIRAPAKSLHISGLNGLTYVDKTDKTQTEPAKKAEKRAVVDVLQFTDFVYEDGPRDYEVTWPDGGIKIHAIGFKDVVVWNPRETEGTKIGDMEEGGWDNYVCVEPGYVAGFKNLGPGEKWIGGQTLTPINAPGIF